MNKDKPISSIAFPKKVIHDWRNMELLIRIKVAISLILYGFMDISCPKVITKEIEWR